MAQSSVADELVERATGRAREKSAGEVERLLAAAEAVLADRGYARLRVDDVLAGAGLSTRAFYRHFQGKSELFLALFDREMHRADERLRAKVAAAPDPEAAVRAWIGATLALAYEPRLARRTRLFLAERHLVASEFPAEVARCVRLLLGPLEEAIAAGRDTGVFPGADAGADALAIHHLCSGITTDRLLGMGELSRADAGALVERFALTTLRGRR
ncbi:MAG TPA: TetR/AcrR family transcriptional regulator [Acidimicrobiia bacterium]